MSDVVIQVENLSKIYRIGLKEKTPDSLVSAASGLVMRPFMNLKRLRRLTNFSETSDGFKDTVWALKDVSFDVRQGEVVGIIGRNGAGKSTLLKILCRITEPTKGRAIVDGRVGSLLEVGTGFHPELTGRENVYLNGVILGMKRAEVKKKFDEIVAFSGVDKFIDTPVKRYSSGMKVRLAFAVAAHLEPDILLVDEVLAVGDVSFQKRCLGKMQDVASEGRTVLFVSHNMAAINNLCQRGMVLDNGEMVFQGEAGSAVHWYVGKAHNPNDENKFSGRASFPQIDSLPAQILEASVVDGQGKPGCTIKYQDDFEVHLSIRIRKPAKDYYTIVYLSDVLGNRVIFTSDADLQEAVIAKMDVGVCHYRLRFPGRILKPERYYVTVNVTEKASGSIDKKESVLTFDIEDHESWRAQNRGYRKNVIIAPEIRWLGDVDLET